MSAVLSRVMALPEASDAEALAAHAALGARDPAAALQVRNTAFDAALLSAERACEHAAHAQVRRAGALRLGADLSSLAASAAGARLGDARGLHAAAAFLGGAAARLDPGEELRLRLAAQHAALDRARTAAARCRGKDGAAFSLADALVFAARYQALCAAPLDPRASPAPGREPDCP